MKITVKYGVILKVLALQTSKGVPYTYHIAVATCLYIQKALNVAQIISEGALSMAKRRLRTYIREKLSDYGYTDAQAARELGVSEGELYNVDMNGSLCRDIAEKVMNLLDIPYNEIINEEIIEEDVTNGQLRYIEYIEGITKGTKLPQVFYGNTKSEANIFIRAYNKLNEEGFYKDTK